jgi:hypothetical protein
LLLLVPQSNKGGHAFSAQFSLETDSIQRPNSGDRTPPIDLDEDPPSTLTRQNSAPPSGSAPVFEAPHVRIADTLNAQQDVFDSRGLRRTDIALL